MPINDYISRWRFDEQSGTTAFDDATNNNDGTLVNGPARVAGQIPPSALDFVASSSQRVEIPHSASLDIVGVITIAAWINPDAESLSGGSQLHYIYSKGFDGSAEVFLRINNTLLQVGEVSGSADWAFNFVAGNWYHVVGRWNGIAWQLFVNATQVASVDVPNGSRSTSGNVGIGAGEILGTYERFWDGRIDDVRVYNRSLNDEEIGELYAYRVDLPPPIFVGSEGGGAGHMGKRAMPYWWRSYIEQWLDELGGKWRESERKRKEQQQAGQAQRFEEWLVAQKLKRQEEMRRAAEKAGRQRIVDEQLQRQLAALRAERDAAEAADAERVKAALTQRDARAQAQRELEDEDELRRLREVARNPRRRFEQRFEAAIEAARRQGWKVKQ